MREPICLINQVFGRLTVLPAPFKKNGRKTLWLCRCECGVERYVRSDQLRGGVAKSCGCLNKEIVAAGRFALKHGQRNNPVYPVWNTMIARCCNPRHKSFHRYGGRGIAVCERWKTFEYFYADMGDRPAPEYSLDRINNERGYEPGNVVWATKREQANNTRKNVFLEFGGERMTIAQWARAIGVKSQLIVDRLRRGWSVERALTTPVH